MLNHVIILNHCAGTSLINFAQILDRKNTEIEELKSHYRSKTQEQMENSSKLENKSKIKIFLRLGV